MRPGFVHALAAVKWASARANEELGLLESRASDFAVLVVDVDRAAEVRRDDQALGEQTWPIPRAGALPTA